MPGIKIGSTTCKASVLNCMSGSRKLALKPVFKMYHIPQFQLHNPCEGAIKMKKQSSEGPLELSFLQAHVWPGQGWGCQRDESEEAEQRKWGRRKGGDRSREMGQGRQGRGDDLELVHIPAMPQTPGVTPDPAY